ncbi:MAG: DUF4468 domain-containing protein [Rikenellaceae bacterium]
MKTFKSAIFALLFIITSGVVSYAQTTNPKYLKGAVPMQDDKVVFSKEIAIGENKEKAFDNAQKLLSGFFASRGLNSGRIVFADKSKNTIIGMGDEILMFKSSALSIDRANMKYKVVVDLNDDETMKVSVSNITYRYEDVLHPAEEYISDEVAFNEKKNKIWPSYEKFRVKTIDFVDEIYGRMMLVEPENLITNTKNKESVAMTPLVEAKHIDAKLVAVQPDDNNIISNIQTVINTIKDVRIAVEYGKDALNTTIFEISDGISLGYMQGKAVVVSNFSANEIYIGQLLKQSSMKFKFYNGQSTTPLLIIECKQLEKPISSGLLYVSEILTIK